MKAVKNRKDAERKPENIHDSKINETPLSQSRRLITAQQMSKIAKGDNPVFLAIVREKNEASPIKEIE